MKPARSHCPISFSLDVVGDKWTLLVLRDLIIVGKRHFRELVASPEGIASNVLSARLKLLELHGLISRRPDPDNGRQKIYAPTAKGLDLLPVMVELIRWGAKHNAQTAAPASFIRNLEADRQRAIAGIRAGHHAA